VIISRWLVTLRSSIFGLVFVLAIILTLAVVVSPASAADNFVGSLVGKAVGGAVAHGQIEGPVSPSSIVPNIAGLWKMVANVAYDFDLVIQQNGYQITGTMTRTNGDEPMDSIEGTIDANGKIVFTRNRAGSFVQVYSGQVSGTGSSLSIGGTYDHDNSGAYSWSASWSGASSTPMGIREQVDVTRYLLADSQGSASSVPTIAGLWKMVGNSAFNFDLQIQQSGDQITGTMTRTNGDEPVDAISGKVYSDWRIEFTRVRPEAFTQVYSGKISDINITLIMDGTFTHDGQGNYPWSATKEVLRQEPSGAQSGAEHRANLVLVGSFRESGAAPGNSYEAYLVINVSHENYTLNENPAVTGLQKSDFAVDTLKVPPYGAEVRILRVTEYPRFSGSYIIALVPASYQGEQYTWLEGIYQLQTTVRSGGLFGQITTSLDIGQGG
jgi:hypothetical protein